MNAYGFQHRLIVFPLVCLGLALLAASSEPAIQNDVGKRTLSFASNLFQFKSSVPIFGLNFVDEKLGGAQFYVLHLHQVQNREGGNVLSPRGYVSHRRLRKYEPLG